MKLVIAAILLASNISLADSYANPSGFTLAHGGKCTAEDTEQGFISRGYFIGRERDRWYATCLKPLEKQKLSTIQNIELTQPSFSRTYNQKLEVRSYVFLNQTIGSGDDVPQQPTEYWLEASIEHGFGFKFFCGTDFNLCADVERELNQTLNAHSRQLSVTTTETIQMTIEPSSSRKLCSFHYQHKTTLGNGSSVDLLEASPYYTCAAPGERLACNPARYGTV